MFQLQKFLQREISDFSMWFCHLQRDGHTRLKRSGAWWYIKYANNMLKIRCAKYNGTYDKIINKYIRDDQERIKNKKFNQNLRIVK